MGVADEAGDARGVPDGAPGLVGEVHADQHVAGDPDAADQLALAVLDLGDLFHGDLDLEDVVLHVEAGDAGLEVGLHAVLVAGVGVDDVPVARLRGAAAALNSADRVDVGASRLGGDLVGVGVLGVLGLHGVLGLRVAAASSVASSAVSSASTDRRRRRRRRASDGAVDGLGLAGVGGVARPRRWVVGGPLLGHVLTCFLASDLSTARGCGRARPAGRRDAAVSRRRPRARACRTPKSSTDDERHDDGHEHEHDAGVGDQLVRVGRTTLRSSAMTWRKNRPMRAEEAGSPACRPGRVRRARRAAGVRRARIGHRSSSRRRPASAAECSTGPDRPLLSVTLCRCSWWCYAGQEGLEPPTAGFGDRCSTN